MKRYYHAVFFLVFSGILKAESLPTAFKPVPARPAIGANVIIEDQETLEACEVEKICVQGRLFNNGAIPAYQVKLRIEAGGAKQGRPRHAWTINADTATMGPGERQEFAITIDRKIPIKDNKGEEKVLEVGKYNFKIVPQWAPAKPERPADKKRKK